MIGESIVPAEFFQINVGQIAQVVVVLFGFGVMFQQLRGDIKNQGIRLEKVEAQLGQLNSVLVSEARQDERISAMDQRMLAQGQRLDATQAQMASRIDTHASLVNSRLEAINNIVAGHTNQLATMKMRQQS